MEYKLEIKQIVDFPRCRIYREFIQNLIEDKNIRTKGSSYLFYFIVLCSYANYRTSGQRYDGIRYTVTAGEWICRISELQHVFRCRYQHQVIAILDYFEKQHYISYSQLDRKKLIRFQITDWKKDNTALNVGKVAELLDTQGIPCCYCSEARYQLSKLLDCRDKLYTSYTLKLSCPSGNSKYQFEITVHEKYRQQPQKAPWTLSRCHLQSEGCYPAIGTTIQNAVW